MLCVFFRHSTTAQDATGIFAGGTLSLQPPPFCNLIPYKSPKKIEPEKVYSALSPSFRADVALPHLNGHWTFVDVEAALSLALAQVSAERVRVTNLALGYGAACFYSIIANIEVLVLTESGIPPPIACPQFPQPNQYPCRWNVIPLHVIPPSPSAQRRVMDYAGALLRHYLAATYSVPSREGGLGPQMLTAAALTLIVDAAARVRTYGESTSDSADSADNADNAVELSKQSPLFRTLTGYSTLPRGARLREGIPFGCPVTISDLTAPLLTDSMLSNPSFLVTREAMLDYVRERNAAYGSLIPFVGQGQTFETSCRQVWRFIRPAAEHGTFNFIAADANNGGHCSMMYCCWLNFL